MVNIEFQDIIRAQQRLSSVVRDTRLIKTAYGGGQTLWLKPENLQLTGSFKIRGAYNKIMSLNEDERKRGVIACSAGNHAQGVAYAARDAGIKAVICMPAGAPKVKVESTRALGAEVVLVPGVYDDAYEKALELQEACGYTFVHPFNDEAVIAGQGTIALEILREHPETDAIVCAVGGGGLLAGISFAAKTVKPDVRVYGVQSAGAPGMYASVANGYVTRLQTVRTFADGIAVKEVGSVSFELAKQYADDIFTVSDKEILEAIKWMMTNENIIAEGAGGAPVAAMMKGLVPPDAKNVVYVVSGGNIDIPLLAKIVTQGLD